MMNEMALDNQKISQSPNNPLKNTKIGVESKSLLQKTSMQNINKTETISAKEAIAKGMTEDDFINKQTPKTVNVWLKDKFSEKGVYVDIPVIEKVENTTLYQGGVGRQYFTSNKKYAAQFGDVKEIKGDFFKVDNGNRVIDVYVKAPSTSQLRTEYQTAK